MKMTDLTERLIDLHIQVSQMPDMDDMQNRIDDCFKSCDRVDGMIEEIRQDFARLNDGKIVG